MGENVSDIQTIVEAIAAQLVAQLNDASISVLTERDANAIPPCVIVDDAPEQQTPTNLSQTQFSELYTIIVCVPFSDQIEAQRELRRFLSTTGDRSIRQALMADVTLGGVVDGLEVLAPSKPTPVGVDEDEDTSYFGSTIPVLIDT